MISIAPDRRLLPQQMSSRPGRHRAGPQPVALVLALAMLSACASSGAQQAGGPVSHPVRVLAERGSVTDGNLHLLHPYLAVRLSLLEGRSPRLRDEMDAIRRGALPVIVAASEPILELGNGIAIRERMPRYRLGEFRVVYDTRTGDVAALLIRVNLPQIVERQQRWFRSHARRQPRRPDVMAEFEAAVDAILIHELWGHLIPVALAGSLDARCADPLPGQADLASCALRRENELRQEMGLQPRTRYKFSRYARP